ncbi:DNA-binding transcriptional regulator, LysR family [Amphibacillus marinus]|uniref:DNA-binding transcriptional regulator, LysR family n=1 Tax=Amphibacillus marinus TaxID=872970 RepID=A0A1H8GQF1_9BACI|nr:LysR family transcriptional regulator [Amphibacillus marinus]SEN46233.1 DNA-binding transcriptional regulator, LysR family [Amphibacillus marinus]
MNIRQLQYFIAIVEQGTILAAANYLGISQPPLSAQLKQLETTLQVKLINRGARKITLTEAGRVLYKRANAIISLANTTIHELTHFQDGQTQTLRLGIISSVGSSLFDHRLQQFCYSHPHIVFDIHEGNTYELLEKLDQDQIDLAIVRSPFQTDGYDCQTLAPEPMVAVATSNFLKNEPEYISVSALQNKPLIYYRRMEHVIISSFLKKEIEPITRCICDDARTALSWAKAGIGIAIVPNSIASLANKEGIIKKEINEKDLFSAIKIVKRSNKQSTQIMSDLIAMF